MPRSASDILVEHLIEWGVTTIFGLPGDDINGFMKALHKVRDRRSTLSTTVCPPHTSHERRSPAGRRGVSPQGEQIEQSERSREPPREDQAAPPTGRYIRRYIRPQCHDRTD
jgi:hypothetical protein